MPDTSLSFISDLWIIGDSYVYWAEQRAAHRQLQHNLSLRQIKGISWAGSRGMKWSQLKHALQYLALHNPSPKAILIHLGSNDLGSLKSIEMRHAMKEDILSIFETFPDASFT